MRCACAPVVYSMHTFSALSRVVSIETFVEGREGGGRLAAVAVTRWAGGALQPCLLVRLLGTVAKLWLANSPSYTSSPARSSGRRLAQPVSVSSELVALARTAREGGWLWLLNTNDNSLLPPGELLRRGTDGRCAGQRTSASYGTVLWRDLHLNGSLPYRLAWASRLARLIRAMRVQRWSGPSTCSVIARARSNRGRAAARSP